MMTHDHKETLTALPRAGDDAGQEPFPPVTPELVDQYLRLGYKLRSKAVTHMSTELSRRIGAFFRRARRPEMRGDARRADCNGRLAERLITPLSAIRSSAEILRDHPDLDSSDHRRFVEIVLAEEARLESLLLEMLPASDDRRRGHLPQARAAQAKLGHESHGLSPT